MYEYVPSTVCLWRPQRGVSPPEGEVTGGCRPLNVSAGNPILALYKSSKLNYSVDISLASLYYYFLNNKGLVYTAHAGLQLWLSNSPAIASWAAV